MSRGCRGVDCQKWFLPRRLTRNERSEELAENTGYCTSSQKDYSVMDLLTKSTRAIVRERERS